MSQLAPARPDVWASISSRIAASPQASDGQEGVWRELEAMVDPAEWRPKLADDIEWKDFHLRWNNDYTMIANPRDLLHIRLEPDAADLVRLMDGTRTVREIVVDRLLVPTPP